MNWSPGWRRGRHVGDRVRPGDLVRVLLDRTADELRLRGVGAIVDHAVQICTSILNQAGRVPPNPTVYGCFTDDGRTTPTATRLEGLLAALTFLPQDQDALRKRIRDHVNKGMSFLIRSQITGGQYAGAIPRGVHPLPQTHPRFTLAFNRRVSEVRIDYVQHALSAMIQYDQMFFHTIANKDLS